MLGGMVDDVVVRAMSALVPGGVRPGELARGERRLRWVEAGSAGPTVVLDAASATSGLTWAPVLPELAEHGRVVVYDRAGLGRSDPASRLTLDQQRGDLAALVRHVGGGRPCVLVGNSWGGALARLAAWTTPELVAGLVLVDPMHEDFQPKLIGLVESAFLRCFSIRVALGLATGALRKEAERNAGCATEDPRVRALLVGAELACYVEPHQLRTVRAEDRMIHAGVPVIRRMREVAPRSAVPVTVLSATSGMPEGLRRRWTALQAQMTADAEYGEHVEVAGAGHYIHTSRPDVVTDAVLRMRAYVQ